MAVAVGKHGGICNGRCQDLLRLAGHRESETFQIDSEKSIVRVLSECDVVSTPSARVTQGTGWDRMGGVEEEEAAAVTATAAFIASVTPKTRGGRSGLPLYQPSEKKQDLESTLGE